MSKRRISNEKVSTIAEERVSHLTRMSVIALKSGKTDRAERYVSLARAVCRKSRTHMPKDFEYCKGCGLPLVPGINQRVRLTRGKKTSTCTGCGRNKRMPYLKERST